MSDITGRCIQHSRRPGCIHRLYTDRSRDLQMADILTLRRLRRSLNAFHSDGQKRKEKGPDLDFAITGVLNPHESQLDACYYDLPRNVGRHESVSIIARAR